MGPDGHLVIPLARPHIDDTDIAAVVAVLRSGMLVQGPEVAALEVALAEVTGTRHAIAVSSGTAALHAAIAGLGVGPGDLVLVPGYSWQATANVVELVGAEVVFVDIDERTYNMAPDALRRVVRQLGDDGRISRVRAAIVVHAFGDIADLDAISSILDPLDIPVVEDAACALGAQLSGAPAGSMGRVGCFSFHPRKAITTGEGGAIVTDDDRLADHARMFRNHGQSSVGGTQRFEIAGANYRMTDLQGALGRSQLAKLDLLVERRRDLVEHYRRLLQDLPVGLAEYVRERTVAQSFVVLLPPDADRDAVIARLAAAGVASAQGTIAMPFTHHFAPRHPRAAEELPLTWEVGRRALALPLHHDLTSDEQTIVVAALADALS